MPDSSHAPRRSTLRNLAVGMAFGSVLTIIGAIAILYFSRGEQLPPITFEILDTAVKRWSENGPDDYDFDAELTGVNPGVVHVEVRGSQVTAMTMNGRPTKPHTWDDWSVPGLLGIIRRDLEVCMAPKKNGEQNEAVDNQSGVAVRANAAQVEIVVPRGTFDLRFGYPSQYHRVTPTGRDAKWQITRFDKATAQ